MTGDGIPSSACTRRPDEIGADRFSSSRLAGNDFPAKRGGGDGDGARRAAAAAFWRAKGGGTLSSSIGYPRMSASGESSTTMHRLLHASGSHPIPPPDDPKVSMTFRVVRTNQYNQNLGLIHSTNGNHLESPNEGSSIYHQVTIYLHA
ncbi:anthocyanidin 5,3-O-glucosyltransferase-like [Dorcoceras hygrometricum]|uniref:Anthocyanidin 5,3-O-glucosyltransferase-like n=1 Tax=Dorcoceras hygrometricum TaxID=472368 RepID=A0A2Z7AV46_9LAMI|nr:anthocyanidin 5,3-O-glucosyltransferase-like [Dorcoceras hygrometricum]